MTTARMIDQGKRSVLGVLVDASTTRPRPTGCSPPPASAGRWPLTALAVHGVMTGVQDRAHNARLNSFDVVTPDGQPVRWALNSLHGAALADRVYGPTLTCGCWPRPPPRACRCTCTARPPRRSTG